jgi:hypothetical protein
MGDYRTNCQSSGGGARQERSLDRRDEAASNKPSFYDACQLLLLVDGHHNACIDTIDPKETRVYFRAIINYFSTGRDVLA